MYVSFTTWSVEELAMVSEPYQYVREDSVGAYLKDRVKKATDDCLTIMFLDIKFE